MTMKIGEFAEKYHVNQSAVRYYIEKALLTPKKINGRYYFDERCGRQMERIQRYKEYHLSLEEIELLFYYAGLSQLRDPGVLEKMMEILTGKMKELEEEAGRLKRSSEDLSDEIDSLRQMRLELGSGDDRITEEKCSAGIPLAALELMRCPACGSRLRVSEAEIEGEGLLKGVLHCACGQEMRIQEGVLCCQGATVRSPFRAFENVDSVRATTEDFSPAYRMLMERGHLWMYQQIMRRDWESPVVLTGPLSYNFLLGHLKNLPEDAFVVIVDPSVQKLRKVRAYYPELGSKLLFIAGELRHVPLKKASVDLYIDDFCGNNYTFTYNENLMQLIAPLLKPEGLVTGCFVDYTKAPKSLQNFRQDHPAFRPELMSVARTRRNLGEAGLTILEECDHGSTAGSRKDFARQAGREKVSLITYTARRDRR